MKYFLHDTNSFNDEKITELYLNFGYEGLGLFYTLLEKIAQQEKPIKTSVLKAQLRVGKRLEKCWNFMEQIGIISSSNGDTFNERLLKFSEKYQIKSEKNRERVAKFREKQADVMHYKRISNASKVKVSKVKVNKESIEKFITPSLDEVKKEIDHKKYTTVTADGFWNFYEAKGWLIGKSKMKNWKSALAGWEARNKKQNPHTETEMEQYARWCVEKWNGDYDQAVFEFTDSKNSKYTINDLPKVKHIIKYGF